MVVPQLDRSARLGLACVAGLAIVVTMIDFRQGATSPNPLDQLEARRIPAGQRPSDPPRELVGVIGPSVITPTGHVQSAAVSADGAWLVVGTRGGRVRLLDVPGLECRREFAAHERGVTALAFAPDGLTLASGGTDGRVRRWSRDGEPLPGGDDATGAAAVQVLSFAPDGRTLAVGRPGRVQLFAVGDACLGPIAEWTVPGSVLFALAFSPDGHRLAVGCGDNAVRIWRLDGGQPQLESASDEQEYRVRAVTFAPGGAAVATLDSEARVIRWDAGGSARGSWPVLNSVCLMAQFAADGRHLLTVHGDGTARILRLPRRWWEL